MNFGFNPLYGIVFLVCMIILYLVRNEKKNPVASGTVIEPEPDFNLESVLEMARQIYGRGYRYNDEIQKALHYPHLLSNEEQLGILKVADRLCEYAGGLIGDKAIDKDGSSYLTQCENLRKVLHIKINKAILKTQS